MNEVGKYSIKYQYHMFIDDESTQEWMMEETGLSFTQLLDQFVELNLKYNLGLTVHNETGWTDIPLT
jgi:hypothetical protein